MMAFNQCGRVSVPLHKCPYATPEYRNTEGYMKDAADRVICFDWDADCHLCGGVEDNLFEFTINPLHIVELGRVVKERLDSAEREKEAKEN